MYVSPQGDDYQIETKGCLGTKLPLVRVKSGHLMMPISTYRSHYLETSNAPSDNNALLNYEDEETKNDEITNEDINLQTTD